MITLSKDSKPVTPELKKSFISPYSKRLIAHIEERERKGVDTYGVPLHTASFHHGRPVDMLKMAFEELLDAMIYIQGAIMESAAVETADILKADLDVTKDRILFETKKVLRMIEERDHSQPHTPDNSSPYAPEIAQ